jgi:hypothetical protein
MKIQTLGLIGLLGLSSCASVHRETYLLPNEIKVVIESPRQINRDYHELGGQESSVLGFCDRYNKTIYVPKSGRDTRGEIEPDFRVLGHEIWHLVKGEFHY